MRAVPGGELLPGPGVGKRDLRRTCANSNFCSDVRGVCSEEGLTAFEKVVHESDGRMRSDRYRRCFDFQSGYVVVIGAPYSMGNTRHERN